MDIFYTDSCVHDVAFLVVWNVILADEKNSVNQPSMNRSFLCVIDKWMDKILRASIHDFAYFANVPLCAWNRNSRHGQLM